MFSLVHLARGADPRSAPFLLNFSLREDPAGIQKIMGAPSHVTSGSRYRLWEYQLEPGEKEAGEYDLVFFFEQPGALLSVTRNYPVAQKVDDLFPAGQSRFHWNRSTASPDFTIRSRVLPGDRVLLAIGVAKPGDPCGQLVIIRKSMLPYFYSQVAASLSR